MNRADVDLDTFAADVAAVTGAVLPPVLAEDAPTLRADVSAESLYFVGLVGGKDVGKTSLVNALAGATLAEPTGHGEGTRHVLAYVHHDAAEVARRRLGDLAGDPSRVQVFPHRHDRLRRHVLLDLPDVDSRYADHVTLVGRVLRGLLYPVFVQSVEKYADAAPQQLLARVAEGNDPGNFLFALTKCDQLIDRDGLEAAGELADDYARRLARVLSLAGPPEVLLTSARRPDDYDLPRLRRRVGVESADRPSRQVAADAARAGARRRASVVAWARSAGLHDRLAAADRLVDEAAERLAEDVARPVLEEALPRWEADAARRMAVAEPAARRRLRAWPLVNVIDTLLAPGVALVRRNLSPGGAAGGDDRSALAVYLASSGRPTRQAVRGVFASLHARHPVLAGVYAPRRPWESPDARALADDLHRRLLDAADAAAREAETAADPPRWLAPLLVPWRWLLTVGAAFWFLVGQPLATLWLNATAFDTRGLLTQAVGLLGAQALLASAGFVVAYLLVLWAVLRAGAYRRVAAWRRRAARDTSGHTCYPSNATPAAQVVAWKNDTLAPLDRYRARLAALVKASDALADDVAAVATDAA